MVPPWSFFQSFDSLVSTLEGKETKSLRSDLVYRVSCLNCISIYPGETISINVSINIHITISYQLCDGSICPSCHIPFVLFLTEYFRLCLRQIKHILFNNEIRTISFVGTYLYKEHCVQTS